MDFKVLKKLIGIVEKSGINELEVEHESLKVRIKKSSTDVSYSTTAPQPTQIVTLAPQTELTQENTTSDAQVDDGLEEIVSPMVGTFYRSPSPGKPNFVEEGDIVQKGDIICIIEAMKLMNEIEAPLSGKINSILVDNAQPVEFGERLVFIQPQ